MDDKKNRKKTYQAAYYLKNKKKFQKYKKEYREKNREKIKEHQKIVHKRWYEKHKKEKLLKNREWHIKNRKRTVEIVQAYVKRNKEKVSSYNRKFSQSTEGRYRMLKYRHNKKWKDDIFMSLDDFIKISNNDCCYCGEKEPHGGIDRIENSKGYTKENSVSCCRFCNYMKKNYTKDFFLEHVRKIVKYNP